MLEQQEEEEAPSAVGEGCRFLTGHSAIVLCVCASADGRLVATAGKVRTFDLNIWRFVTRLLAIWGDFG